MDGEALTENDTQQMGRDARSVRTVADELPIEYRDRVPGEAGVLTRASARREAIVSVHACGEQPECATQRATRDARVAVNDVDSDVRTAAHSGYLSSVQSERDTRRAVGDAVEVAVNDVDPEARTPAYSGSLSSVQSERATRRAVGDAVQVAVNDADSEVRNAAHIGYLGSVQSERATRRVVGDAVEVAVNHVDPEARTAAHSGSLSSVQSERAPRRVVGDAVQVAVNDADSEVRNAAHIGYLGSVQSERAARRAVGDAVEAAVNDVLAQNVLFADEEYAPEKESLAGARAAARRGAVVSAAPGEDQQIFAAAKNATITVANDPLQLYDIVLGGADHHGALLLDRFQRLEEKVYRRISLIEDLLLSKNEDMVNAELQHLDQRLFELRQVSESCVDPTTADAVEKAEERVFELKVSVSSWLKSLDENRSVSGRSCHSQRSRASRKSEASRRSKGSLRSVSSGGSVVSVENEARIAALERRRSCCPVPSRGEQKQKPSAQRP